MKILISVGFGAGWSSWCSGGINEEMFMLTNETLINAVENNTDLGNENDPNTPLGKFVNEYKAKFGKDSCPYLGGAIGLEVLDVGDEPFIIEEYDGAESIRFKNLESWFNE